MYSQIAANKRKTIILMLAFVTFVALLGYVFALALGGSENAGGGGILFFIVAIIYVVISYFLSSKLTLAIAKARPVQKSDAPELYRTVENLAITSGLPMPNIYIINDAQPNAFATGRDPKHSSVAVTTGLLEILEPAELQGVIAHELSHVGNYDIRLMALVVSLVTLVALMSDLFLRWNIFGRNRDDNQGGNAVFLIIGIVMALLAPLVAAVAQLAISRKREYLADASGALLTRYPQGLAGALKKIADSDVDSRTASTATAHMYFSNPFKSKRRALAGLFSTHPPIEDRIARLVEMENKV